MTDQQSPTSAARKPFHRLLLTGAAGNLGVQLRGALGGWADVVRLSDIAPIDALASHEEAAQVDLADRAAVDAMLDGVDAVVHLGGISIDAPFDDLLEANIRGLYNLYAAAVKHRVK